MDKILILKNNTLESEIRFKKFKYEYDSLKEKFESVSKENSALINLNF